MGALPRAGSSPAPGTKTPAQCGGFCNGTMARESTGAKPVPRSEAAPQGPRGNRTPSHARKKPNNKNWSRPGNPARPRSFRQGDEVLPWGLWRKPMSTPSKNATQRSNRPICFRRFGRTSLSLRQPELPREDGTPRAKARWTPRWVRWPTLRPPPWGRSKRSPWPVACSLWLVGFVRS